MSNEGWIVTGAFVAFGIFMGSPYLWCRFVRKLTCHRCDAKCQFTGFGIADIAVYTCPQCNRDYCYDPRGVTNDQTILEHRLWM
jgi:hypothetical protein